MSQSPSGDRPLTLTSPQATQTLAYLLGKSATAGSVLLLEGNLGGGKTTFVQGLGKGLGIEDAILSPTFTLVQEYWEGRLPLFHCDLYRLTPEAVYDLSLDELWVGEGVMAIEWPDRLPELPPEWLRLRLEVVDETRRLASASASGDRHYHWWQQTVRQFASSHPNSQ
ncbi:tRNA (adenosine(37)-N6)-threonylcarbamoyltransferase complex ATPase subunit type 1 TsaE [Synechococcus sp. PCC 7336]|uniref:tRNA (adenosine(37)-N6)-threonylcarbamoyltransferase complex ATPase subunit type 1 TsaE n=1 Tax=Synechococcus sp. PCC 7336 TaxID=195250 RepID=UPI000345E8D3|nr:tRNA (adenosine(37)-N6)-threonylcarbamoyltransferase complex ATPase subunit type 1 TsaE [Synechococcus sp. PCC 7336]